MAAASGPGAADGRRRRLRLRDGHLLLYTASEAFDLAKVASEIVLRIYLTIGFAAVLGLSALAATSTDSHGPPPGPAAGRRCTGWST